jgi:pimeloyl-ACP methyl ester carboxylesterase
MPHAIRHRSIQANGIRMHVAVAPDMRGYGDTDAPADPAQYRTTVICADIAGLLDALELERAVIVGHDWGGYHLWQFGLRHPGRCAKLVGLNTPYAPPGPVPPTQALRERFGENGYYSLWHQTPGARRPSSRPISPATSGRSSRALTTRPTSGRWRRSEAPAGACSTTCPKTAAS